jgi:hypothetical protein
MDLSLAGLMMASGLVAGPCPDTDGYPPAMGRRALEEIMIHDAYGADGSGNSIFGLIYEAPIRIRYAVDGEPLALEGRESVDAVRMEEVEAVWILGDEASGPVLDLVSDAAANRNNIGVCIEVVTLPLDEEAVKATEEVGGPGSPGGRLVILHNVIFSNAEFLAVYRVQRDAIDARMRGAPPPGVLNQRVPVAAPWFRDAPEMEDHPGLWLQILSMRGDARDFIPRR